MAPVSQRRLQQRGERLSGEERDGARLPELASKQNTASSLSVDTACRSKKNGALLKRGIFKSNIFESNIHQRRMPCPSLGAIEVLASKTVSTDAWHAAWGDIRNTRDDVRLYCEVVDANRPVADSRALSGNPDLNGVLTLVSGSRSDLPHRDARISRARPG